MLRVLLVLVAVALYISFVVDVVRTPGSLVRSLPKAVWLIVVVLVPLVGGLLWTLLGRPRSTGSWFAARRVTAPDDDPAFLKALDEEAWRRRMRERHARDDGSAPA